LSGAFAPGDHLNGRGAADWRFIRDLDVPIPEGTTVGYDTEAVCQGYFVTEAASRWSGKNIPFWRIR
jgi:hypothetical protein